MSLPPLMECWNQRCRQDDYCGHEQAIKHNIDQEEMHTFRGQIKQINHLDWPIVDYINLWATLSSVMNVHGHAHQEVAIQHWTGTIVIL